MRDTKEIDKILDEICDILDDEVRGIESFIPARGMEYIGTKDTFCKKMREIYMSTDNPKIRELTIESTLMAKKMAKKLLEYRTGRLTKKKK